MDVHLWMDVGAYAVQVCGYANSMYKYKPLASTCVVCVYVSVLCFAAVSLHVCVLSADSFV